MCKRIFANQTSEQGDVPFYKIGTIGTEPDAYISRELFEEYKAKYKYPREGEVMVTCAGTVGKTIVFDGADSYYQDSNIVWLSNPKQLYINSFLNYFLSRVNWNKLNSTTITRIYNDNLRELVIKYPSVKEQEKIVSLLSLLDQKISIQSKIIKESLILKKVLCHKLFDSSKNSVSLASIADIEMGQSPDSSSYNRDSLGIPLIQGNLDIKDGNTAPSIWTTQITKQCEIGDVILTVRAPVGEVAISSHNACIGRGVCRIRSRSSTLSSNIFQYLSFFSDWGHYEQGSTFTAINRKDIEKLSIPLLSPHELRLLSNIDEHLRISRILLRKYCSFKDSCLKQMFV